jgi:hypothetical protein
MKTQQLPEHSPVGGSSMERLIHCAGSVKVGLGHADPESEYAAEGTAAHSLGEICLRCNEDAWTHIARGSGPGEGLTLPNGEEIWPSKDMADAVQVYLDAVRSEHPDRNQGNTWIERPFHVPSIHPLCYGRADLVYLEGSIRNGRTYWVLHVWDYKHGAGIVVDVEENPQEMYYACAMLEDLDLWGTVDEVVLHIVQPRGWMEPHRTWRTTPEELSDWCDEVMIPVLTKAADLMSRDITVEALMEHLASGEHCRFCPARFGRCPRHEADMIEMEGLMKTIEAGGGASKASNEDLGRFLTLFEVAKIKQKAYRETAFMRAQNSGAKVPGWKLVRAKSNREWKEGVEDKAKKKFGKDAYEPAKLKTPAKIESLPGGKDFAAEYAFKPDTGLQLAPETEMRPEAGPKGRAAFKPVAQKRSK